MEELEEVAVVFERLRAFQIRTGELRGAFARQLNEHNEPVEAQAGPFPTIEGLYPFLIYPKKEDYFDVLLDGLAYLVQTAKKNDNLLSVSPEYPRVSKPHKFVDGNAYGLRVLTLARAFIRKYPSDAGAQLVAGIDEIISTIIRLIDDSKLAVDPQEYGWPLVAGEGLPARTYSTALVLLGLGSCRSEDFSRSGIMNAGRLVEFGVKFLLVGQNNIEHSQHRGGWSFLRADAEIDDAGAGLEVNPNITADVCFALGHLVRNPWNPAEKNVQAYYDSVQSAVRLGNKYIQAEYHKNQLKEFETVDELVEYPSERGIRSWTFSHPISMVLPALLILQDVSVRDPFVVEMAKRIQAKLGEKQRYENWRVFDFSDLAIAQTYLWSLRHGIEGMLDKLASDGDIPRCLIDQGIAVCPELPAAASAAGGRIVVPQKALKPNELGEYVPLPSLGGAARAVHEFKELAESFLQEQKTATIIDNMGYSVELIWKVGEWVTIKLQHFSQFDAMKRTCAAVTGSVGRLEANEGSDVDFYVLVDDRTRTGQSFQADPAAKYGWFLLKSMARWLKESEGLRVDRYDRILAPDYLDKANPKMDHFPTFFPLSALLKVGDPSEDVEELVTKRHALICESVPVFNGDLFEELRREVLKNYNFHSDVAVKQLPQALIRDIDKLYGSYFTRSEQLTKTDDLRTVKIWHMRGVAFIGLITRLRSLRLGKSDITAEAVERILREPPLLRIARLGQIIGDGGPLVREMVEKYNDSLSALNDPTVREYLKTGAVREGNERRFENIKMQLLHRGARVRQLMEEMERLTEEKVQAKHEG